MVVRIAVAGFQHETNTFGATLATIKEFEIADAWPELLVGPDVIAGTAGINLPITGFIDAAESDGDIELVPLLWCSAEPSSYVEDAAFDTISGMILDGLAVAGPIDGVFVDLHGAMVCQSAEDGEGELLARLRARLGLDLPIVVSLDLHANLTDKMVELASAICIYRTYPHLDMADCGGRAFAVMQKLLRDGPLAKAYRQVPFLIPLQSQDTGAEPCKSLYGGLGAVDAQSFPYAEIAIGFPPADIADTGAAVVAYADDQASADRLADATLAAIMEAETQFDATMLSAAEAVRTAMSIGGSKPVVIADVQDNPGAGATSDSTGLLAALVEEGAQGAVVAILDDAEIAAKAHAEGVGSEFLADLGGKSGLPQQIPYRRRFHVEALTNGIFAFTGEMYGGSHAHLGPTALLRIVDERSDVRVIVGSNRCQCVDLAIFRHIGVEPTQQQILIVKSTVHFRADFQPIAEKVLVAEAPGANRCRLDAIPYRNLRPGVRLGPNGPAHGLPAKS